MSTMHVSGLFVYPIKSCGGVALTSARLVRGGLQFDRRYMLVDETGRFITARTSPQLLSVVVALDPHHALPICVSHPALAQDLRLAAACMSEERVRVSVWSDEAWALLDKGGSDWFSAYLKRAVRLVYLPDEHLRQINLKRSRAGELVSFADGYPLLLTNEASLLDLNERLAVPVGMERFRPNVVVQGARPFAEDTWASVAIGPVEFKAPKLCDRCVMTTVDAPSGLSSKEPLRTLATFRKWAGAVWFGTNLVPQQFEHDLTVGDKLTVQEERPHPREQQDEELG